MEAVSKIREIESRLRKKAAEIWEVEEEKLKDFDPLVNLLIGACASEFVRIYDVLEDADAIVLERLAKITLPEILVGPKPGHTILYAQPDVNNVVLKRNKSRIYVPNHKLRHSEEEQDFYFSPVRDFKLYNGSIRRIAYGNMLYEIENPKSKIPLLEVRNEAIPYGHFWFGIELKERISTTENLPFYFQPKEDNKENQDSKDFLSLLPMTKWYDDTEHPISVKEGLPIHIDEKNVRIAFEESEQIEKEVLSFYNKHYITLNPEGLEEKTNNYPRAFEAYFDTNELFKLQGDFVWIKAEFSSAIKAEVFENLLVTINAVPVLNRLKKDKTANLTKGINVNSLSNDDNRQFLSVESVTNDKNDPYEAIYTPTLKLQQKGTYALRRGRLSKMDKREAYEMLDYLSSLVRDERMAFKALDRPQLSKGLKQVEDWLELFLNSSGNPGEVPTFLLLNPKDGDDRIYLNYWTTMGDEADTIKSTARLSLETGDDIQTDSLLFLRDVKGGRNRPDFHQRLNIFKSAFLSRGRIVTVEDIKVKCFEELEKWIDAVEVSVGYKAGETPTLGILKIIKVELLPSKEWLRDKLIDRTFWEKRIKRILESQSSGFQSFEVSLLERKIYNE